MDDIFNVDLSEFETEAEDTGADQPGSEVDAAEEASNEASEAESRETAGAEEAGSSETFALRWLDQTKNVSKEEVIALAQRGLDYDRVRGKYENSKEELSQLREFRTKNQGIVSEIASYMEETGGKDLAEILDELRVDTLVRGGVSRDLAVEKVARQRAERALSAAQPGEKTQEAGQTQAQKDLAEFTKLFPDVDLKKVLPELKSDIESTGNLTMAYHRYETRRLAEENRKLQDQLKAKEQATENRRRAPGSQRATGSEEGKDPFLDILNSYD